MAASITTRRPTSITQAAPQLWWADLDESWARAGQGDLEAHLTPAERERADGLLRPLYRNRFIAARAALRQLLASRLDCRPNEAPIVLTETGKPRLAGEELGFSVAHSDGLALFALSPGLEVGVDLEAIEETTDVERLATRFFSLAERTALASLPPAHRRPAAFRCWTRKEAFAKGTGEGLHAPLAALEVGIGGSRRLDGGWFVHEIAVAPGFAAALAARGPGADRPPGLPREIR
jgi:4'-phosphopantetheinyl transferase